MSDVQRVPIYRHPETPWAHYHAEHHEELADLEAKLEQATETSHQALKKLRAVLSEEELQHGGFIKESALRADAAEELEKRAIAFDDLFPKYLELKAENQELNEFFNQGWVARCRTAEWLLAEREWRFVDVDVTLAEKPRGYDWRIVLFDATTSLSEALERAETAEKELAELKAENSQIAKTSIWAQKQLSASLAASEERVRKLEEALKEIARPEQPGELARTPSHIVAAVALSSEATL